VGGMNVNVWGVTEKIEALVRDGRPALLDRLADPDIPLDSVSF
jgi:3-phenylpropionate/trans-cinnamate dioxygenase ferredoxin reductase component